MSHRYSRSSVLLVALLLVLASRLPFLGPGYGVDGDAWRVVQSGLHFVQTGEYRYSRQPGYPLQEALGGLVAAQPYWVGNLVTAAMSALACMLGATYAVLTGRIAVAGLLLGLAPGFRASSATMFLPLACSGCRAHLQWRPVLHRQPPGHVRVP